MKIIGASNTGGCLHYQIYKISSIIFFLKFFEIFEKIKFLKGVVSKVLNSATFWSNKNEKKKNNKKTRKHMNNKIVGFFLFYPFYQHKMLRQANNMCREFGSY